MDNKTQFKQWLSINPPKKHTIETIRLKRKKIGEYIMSMNQTFYEFLGESTTSTNTQLRKYASALYGYINTLPKFPKKNRDRKTVERSLKASMGEHFDSFMFEYVWQAYEQRKMMSMFFN